MLRETAETLALQALSWLLTDPQLLNDFLVASGASAGELSASAQRPEFLASVLDFLLMEDRWIMAFCDAFALDYGQPMRARAALPGGEVLNWT